MGVRSTAQGAVAFVIIVAAGGWFAASAVGATRAVTFVITVWSLLHYLRAGWLAAKQMRDQDTSAEPVRSVQVL